MRLAAAVFDFDGLIIDSEWGIYETARAACAAHGDDLSVEAWATVVGINDDDDEWFDVLRSAAALRITHEQFDAAYAAQDRSNRDSLPALPGVVDLVDELRAAGVPIGIASSSGTSWLDRHLTRLGLLDHFDTIVGADVVGGVGKPAPDVYLKACADLGAAPARAVAIEDSAHGVTAARAAGMRAVAVPSRITIFNDFSHADLVVSSVAALTVDRLDGVVAWRRVGEADPPSQG